MTAECAFMAQRRSSLGLFLLSPDSIPVTKVGFMSIVREALWELGLPQEQFAVHSFRIEATTAATPAGLEDSTIMMLCK